jgi:gas vesicle protein
MAHSHSVKQYPGQLAGILAIGAAVGAGAAMLFAPKSGAETRRQLRGHMDTMKFKMQKKAKPVSYKTDEGVERMKAAASKLKTQSKDTADKTKRTTKRTADKGKDITDEIRRNGEP